MSLTIGSNRIIKLRWWPHKLDYHFYRKRIVKLIISHYHFCTLFVIAICSYFVFLRVISYPSFPPQRLDMFILSTHYHTLLRIVTHYHTLSHVVTPTIIPNIWSFTCYSNNSNKSLQILMFLLQFHYSIQPTQLLVDSINSLNQFTHSTSFHSLSYLLPF